MNKQIIIRLAIILCFPIVLFQSCDKSPSEYDESITFGDNSFEKGTYTIVVHQKMQPCQGISPQKCLLVKIKGNDGWSLFYEGIEGFEYNEGFRYELLIQVDEVKNPPKDASTLKFKMLELIKKERVSI